VLVYRAALGRHVAPEGGQRLLQPGAAVDNQEFWLAQPALDEIAATSIIPVSSVPTGRRNGLLNAPSELGLTFLEPIPQQIHVLTDKPNYPGAPGDARVIGPADVELFADWTIAFLREAVPHDPLPSRERLAQIAAEGRTRANISASNFTSTATCTSSSSGATWWRRPTRSSSTTTARRSPTAGRPPHK
jgi:hypothetical protein